MISNNKALPVLMEDKFQDCNVMLNYLSKVKKFMSRTSGKMVTEPNLASNTAISKVELVFAE